jgi:AcrR family transcriptional regulator
MKKRDAKATKAKIMKNARDLFSKKGFDATTIDDIADVSSVNKALIYYYFKNKSGLYSEVMSALFDAIYEDVRKAKEEAKSSEEELELFITTYAKYAEKNPYLPALLLRELSDSGAHLPAVMFASMRKVYGLLEEILKGGSFKKSIPMVVHFMIIGAINLMVTTKPLRQKAEEIDSSVDTCNSCTIDEIAAYIFQTIKKSLEVA